MTPEGMTPEEAAQHVEIGHFVRKGFKPKGVIHVGANDGYEVGFYLAMGCQPILAFEPLHSAFVKLYQRFGSDHRVRCFPFALGSGPEVRLLHVSPGDGMGSTFLHEYSMQYPIVAEQLTPILRFDSHFTTDRYNTLVLDVQGMELDVLYGFGEDLVELDFLNIECSRVPLFKDEASADEVIRFLKHYGFEQDSPIEDHNDIKFIHKRNP